jgi:hypothetical protein
MIVAILDEMKTALRISKSNTVFDGEVNDLIEEARDDLRLAGVLGSKVDDSDDHLIKRAIRTYCKANFGFDNPDAERLQASYDSLKSHLTLSQEYTVEVEPS